MKKISLSVIVLILLSTPVLCLPQAVLAVIPDQGSPFMARSSQETFLWTQSINERPHHVSNSQHLFISLDGASIFYSLDLTVPWPATKPAWKKLPPPPSTGWWDKPYGWMSLSKDGSTVRFVSYSSIQSYHVNTAQWDLSVNLTLSVGFGYGGYIVTDADMGRVYGFGSTQRHRGQISTPFVVFDPVSRIAALLNEPPSRVDGQFAQGVYSAARKSLYFLPERGALTLYEYSIGSDTWAKVDAKNDLIPSPRDGACFTTANGGRTLILAVGAKDSRNYPSWGCSSTFNTITGEYQKNCAEKRNDVLNDVYTFDVETSVWTQIATAPVGYFNPVCAVSGNFLILYGGYREINRYAISGVPNSNVPSIYNLKTNTWVSDYVPS
ncbi:hypothetical protein CPB97_003456 [Podila verticillata]|nr:hypothetical protein CPB97_003456 [Podila verticillata]